MNTPTYFDKTEARIGDKVQHGLYGQCIVVGMDKAADELNVVNVLTGEEINCLSINCDLLHRDGGFQWIRMEIHKPANDRRILFRDTDPDYFYTGRYEFDEDTPEEWGRCPRWVMAGRDGYTVEHVTHWMPILPVSI